MGSGGCRKTASSDWQVCYMERQQATIGNVIDIPTWNVFPTCVTARMMIFYRRAALSNGIIKLTSRKHVFTSETILTIDAARLSYANLHTEIHKISSFIARYFHTQEARVFQGLFSAFYLRL